jgi:hemolysin type calcium-binding protein
MTAHPQINPRSTSHVRRRRTAALAASSLAVLGLALSSGPVAAAAPKVTAGVADDTLFVLGSQKADQIALRLDPRNPDVLNVDVDDNDTIDFSFFRDTFDTIVVLAGNGDDTVRIDQANGVFTTTERTVVLGQNGDDTFIGGSGNELFFGGRGNDVEDGNGGIDTAFLGQGNDTFIWDPGDGSDTVDGGRGFDRMVFNGASGNEIMAATASGSRVHFTRNLGNILMDLDGIEAIDVNALGGTDTVTVNDVTGTDLSQVNVDLAGALGGSDPDGAADTVTVKGTDGVDTIAATADGAAVDVTGLTASVRITHTDPDKDSLVVDTAAGDDHVALDPGLPSLILASVK